MRNFIDIIMESAILNEGTSFHPSIKTIEDGKIFIDFPNSRKIQFPCRNCEYEKEYGFNDRSKCEDCGGTEFETDTVYDFPCLDVSIQNAAIIKKILGCIDDDDDCGLIENHELPNMMRRLIKLKNTSTNDFSRDRSENRRVSIDRTGNIPTIRSGPRMIDMGVPQSQITQYIDRLIEIVNWAINNKAVVSWA
jgi:predicted nucleic-acid-binding Zn-ribbon protein